MTPKLQVNDSDVSAGVCYIVQGSKNASYCNKFQLAEPPVAFKFASKSRGPLFRKLCHEDSLRAGCGAKSIPATRTPQGLLV